ncbi:MAG: flagellar hook-length control protein FliK [Planctomycetota bacterium]
MDPIRENPSLPPPAPIQRAGPGRGRAGEGDASARQAPHAPADPAALGRALPKQGARQVPPRASEDLARAAAELEAGLSADADAGERDALEAARARLAALAMDPRGGADLLRELAGQGAVPLRVALLAAAAELRGAAPAATLEAALDAFATRLVNALPTLGGASTEAALAAAREGLAAALQRVAQVGLPPAGALHTGVSAADLHALTSGILDALVRALGGRDGAAPEGRAGLLAGLARADQGALALRLGGPALATFLALPADSPLRQQLTQRALAGVHPGARDARLALLAELLDGDAGSTERALARLVGALEGEAAANAARRDMGEPTVWTLPMMDGPRWSTITLLEDRHGRDAREEGGDDAGTRVAIGTDFSGLGPVRADLAVSRERLVLRFMIADPETARAVRIAAPELRERLAAMGREVLVAVAESAPEAARVEQPPPILDHLDLRG